MNKQGTQLSLTTSNLGNVANLYRDRIKPEELNEPTKYIGLKHIRAHDLQLNGHGWASDTKSAKYKFKKGDILLGKLRPYFRKAVIAPYDGVCSTDIWVIRPKQNIDRNFLFYYLANYGFIDAINGASQGTRMPRAKWSFASSLAFPDIPYVRQQEIGKRLRCFDQKIRLNQQMNETLEMIAQAIFKSWFVDFDPVHAKANGEDPIGMDKETADLFPSEFDENGVPKDWQIVKLNKISSHLREVVSPNDQPQKVWSHYSIPAFDKGMLPVHEMGKEIKSNKYQVFSNCILLSKLNPDTKRIWLTYDQNLNGAICSTEFVQLKPRENFHYTFLYFCINSKPLYSQILSKASGSTGSRQRTRPSQIMQASIVLPGKKLLKRFDAIVSDTLEIIKSNRLNNDSMQKIRDTLIRELI